MTEPMMGDEKIQRVVSFIGGNRHLQEVEITNSFVDVQRKSRIQCTALWTNMLRHPKLSSIRMQNTNLLQRSARRCRGWQREFLLNTTLTHHYITNCNIGAAECENLCQNMQYNTGLRFLVLSDNKLCDKGIAALCRLFQGTRRTHIGIVHLDVSGNTFGLQGLRSIVQTIIRGKCNKVSELILENNCIDDVGAALIAESLLDNQTLRTLNLRSNDIGPLGLHSIGDMLKRNTTLCMLSVAENTIDETIEQQWLGVLETNTSLRSLDISRMWRDDEDDTGPARLVGILGGSNRICYLRCDGIHTDSSSMNHMQNMIACNMSLQRLSLAACGLTVDLTLMLAQGLSRNKSILEVDISGNRICKQQGYLRALDLCFWNLLAKNTTLNTLRMQGNALGSTSIWFAIDFIAEHKTLQVLDISDNLINSFGALAVLHGLARNTSLNVLDVSQNQLLPEEYSILVSRIIKKRICAQQNMPLHVHGMSLDVSSDEFDVFMSSAYCTQQHMTKHDVLHAWRVQCEDRKLAFMLASHSRLCTTLWGALSTDMCRLILANDIFFSTSTRLPAECPTPSHTLSTRKTPHTRSET